MNIKQSLILLSFTLAFLYSSTATSQNIDWSTSSMSPINGTTIRVYDFEFEPTPGVSYNIDFIFNEDTLSFVPDASSLEALDTQQYEAASVSRGGRLYDSWWLTNGQSAPTDTYTLYPQNVGQQSGAATWRCKECHGWDYKGKEGAYGNGSDHFTGIKGVFHAQQKPIGEIYSIIKSKNLPLSEEDLWDLTKFIKEGVFDMDKHIIFSGTQSKVATGNSNSGRSIYTGRCTTCHEADGKGIGITIGAHANNNPWEAAHKISFGNPGTSMPSLVNFDNTIEQIIDVLTYVQTLPQE